tara:strand:- start:899 stop:2029 length:1131 start_codon:yes stop_codon:yes gene_type:complete
MKYYFSILLFIIIKLNISSQLVYNWQNSKEGWVSCNNCNCNLTAQTDAMAMRLFSSNAKMLSGNLSSNLGISGLDYNQVEIILKNPNSGSGVARLFIYPPGSNNDTCYYTFQVDTSMTSFSTYTISLDSIPSGGLSSVYNGPIARFGLRSPWGGMNFDTVFWKQMVVSNTNLVADTVDITFKVDMNQSGYGSTAIPYLRGSWDWGGPGDLMTDIDGDGVWQVVKQIDGVAEYLFAVDTNSTIGWDVNELNDPTELCTNGDITYTNRVLSQALLDTTLGIVCWASCDPCLVVPTTVNSDVINNVLIYPNPASKILNIKSKYLINPISIYDISGKLVLQSIGDSKELNIDISNLHSGLYFIKSSFSNSPLKRTFMINK